MIPKMPAIARSDRDNLSNTVAQYVVKYIDGKRLQSGDKLPSEIQVSADLKISRGVVREAFRALRTAGIIEVANGRSPHVGALKNTVFSQLIRHALSTRQVSPEQVLDLRSSIEVRAAELAATHRDSGHIRTLRLAVAGMRRTQRNPDRFVPHDIRFHETIGQATGNPLFALLAGPLRESLGVSIRAGLESRTTQAQLNRIVDTHAAIVDAIEAQRAPKAAELMTVHFEEAKNALRGTSRRTVRR